jgi:hypothetical protein
MTTTIEAAAPHFEHQFEPVGDSDIATPGDRNRLVDAATREGP